MSAPQPDSTPDQQPANSVYWASITVASFVLVLWGAGLKIPMKIPGTQYLIPKFTA